MLREVGNDVTRRMCQYEVPGGGVCHDSTCTDIHGNDLQPGDHETACYLLETMPSVLQAYNEAEIADQLLQARQKKATSNKASTHGTGSASASVVTMEEVVADAVAALTGHQA